MGLLDVFAALRASYKTLLLATGNKVNEIKSGNALIET